jgi:NAD(P)-dependent dehydrogenase (short-subunit alcohol dehydrogenase family)
MSNAADKPTTNEPTETELEICLKVLRQAASNPAAFDESLEFKTLVAKVNRMARKQLRQQSLLTRQEHDSSVKQGILEGRSRSESQPESQPGSQVARGLRLSRPRRCYVCKNLYQDCHAFYHLMCADCGEFNHAKREQRSDLNGRVALLTGGRIKIGFELALKLLRDGARVIVTTRFPNDAFQRFAMQADAHEWQQRLSLHGLDLRHIPSVQAFIDDLKMRESHLDILINNAAQTISRPPAFYQHLFETEHLELPKAQGTVQSPMQFFAQAALELPTATQYFPAGVFDQDGQQLDARPINSWLQRLAEVGTRDLLEVQLVNTIAPFMLCSQLKPLLLQSPNPRRFIINVSAMEGQFNRTSKGVYHPHTNMAKAALNMLTRTSASDYAKDNIFINSVDTGWVTDENPLPKAQRLREQGFFTPLDHIDGAARIYDPIARGLNESETPVFGAFLKDYAPHPW